ncbi:uncharacterized protein L3040_007109 [Drepanopeziza brunnea f. sp. 'multigermtubi']|uniref:uncharacterized protein n=1 Tax=Drepanopeziza brunnea f. sp. 'multigermtubi' TaxID=698441 RepID=UPI002390DC26|nr:hypothetical protein L3040_007109 [Drepanopeziza brunnea f. sp. 'multigermtubi']
MPDAPNIPAFTKLDDVDDFDRKDPEKWFKERAQQGQVVMPSSFLSPSEAKEEVKSRAASIWSNYDLLGQILDRHEATIRKRWLKKTKKQQKSILLAAWPEMAPFHRPDFGALELEASVGRPDGKTKFREWYLWPVMNLEDLTVRRSLLHFLHSRGRNQPSAFARSDYIRTKIARSTGAVGAPLLLEHTIYLDGDTATSYGRLASWKDDMNALDDVMHDRSFNFGYGLITLEIQDRIMQFLIDCCRLILHDMNESTSLIDPQFAVQGTLPPVTTDTSEYPTTVTLAIERQYRAPRSFEYKRMRGIIGAKLSEAEDHILLLREDPSYYKDTITEFGQHRNERLIDTNGHDHPVGPRGSQDHACFWERVIAHMTEDAYLSLIDWNIIEKQLAVLETLQEKYISIISPQKRLPDEYLHAFLTFKQMLMEAQRRVMKNLQNDAPASPPLRGHYVRQPPSPHSTLTIIQMLPLTLGSDNLLFKLQALSDPDKTHQYGLSDMLDDLERFIIEYPGEKCRLSSRVMNLISNLGFFAQIRDEIENYQPWASSMEYEFSKLHKGVVEEVFEKFKVRQVIENNIMYVSTGLETLGAPISPFEDRDIRFYYPIEKQRTKENHQAMRKAEQDLDAFWKKFDTKFRYKVGETLNEIVGGFLFENRDLKRTPEWVEPINITPAPKRSKQEATEELFSGLDLDTKTSVSTKVSATVKTKNGTGGQASNPQAGADDSEAEAQPSKKTTRSGNSTYAKRKPARKR